jgi:hypothetical protein
MREEKRPLDPGESPTVDGSSLEQASVIVRDFHPDTDQPIIYATWRNGAYYGALNRKDEIEKPAEARKFFRKKTTEIRWILRKSNVRIACLSDDPHTIIGFAVFAGDHLNWVFVKSDYRNKGIANLLVPQGTKTCTYSITKVGAVIAQKRGWLLKAD